MRGPAEGSKVVAALDWEAPLAGTAAVAAVLACLLGGAVGGGGCC
jgi:hypothetical protein